MHRTYKIALSGILIAIGVVSGSVLFIPIGVIKAFPVQHVINILSAMVLGPWYAILNAFCISLIRNLMGTGSILAFPGSMIGAGISGFLFYKTQRVSFAYLGEIVGTGIIGAGIAALMAQKILGSTSGFQLFFTSFFFSTLVGSSIGLLIFKSIRHIGALNYENRS